MSCESHHLLDHVVHFGFHYYSWQVNCSDKFQEYLKWVLNCIMDDYCLLVVFLNCALRAIRILKTGSMHLSSIDYKLQHTLNDCVNWKHELYAYTRNCAPFGLHKYVIRFIKTLTMMYILVHHAEQALLLLTTDIQSWISLILGIEQCSAHYKQQRSQWI